MNNTLKQFGAAFSDIAVPNIRPSEIPGHFLKQLRNAGTLEEKKRIIASAIEVLPYLASKDDLEGEILVSGLIEHTKEFDKQASSFKLSFLKSQNAEKESLTDFVIQNVSEIFPEIWKQRSYEGARYETMSESNAVYIAEILANYKSDTISAEDIAKKLTSCAREAVMDNPRFAGALLTLAAAALSTENSAEIRAFGHFSYEDESSTFWRIEKGGYELEICSQSLAAQAAQFPSDPYALSLLQQAKIFSGFFDGTLKEDEVGVKVIRGFKPGLRTVDAQASKPRVALPSGPTIIDI